MVNMKIKINWELFKMRYMLENNIYVKEQSDKWVMVTYDGPLIIMTEKEKALDDEENIMFVDKYFSDKKNIVKTISIDEIDEPKDPMPTDDEEFEVKLENDI